MRSTAFVWAIAAVLLLSAAPALAQGAATTFLSSAGNDDNDCSTPATACESFGRANNQTQAGGTILVLDSHSYDPGSITKSLNIVAQGPAAVVDFAASGGPDHFAALSINTAAGDVVTIRGLTLGGNNHSFDGINFIGAGALHVEDCAIHDNHTGIEFIPSGDAELYVTNCTIGDNGASTFGAGIFVNPMGSASAKVVLDNVHVENNRVGIQASSGFTSGTVDVVIRDSVTFGNTNYGILSGGARSVVRVADSTVSGNQRGVLQVNGAQIISHGGNILAGNNVNGAFSATVPPQ